MEEWAVEGSTATLTCYTLGDDVIAQKKTYWQWVVSQWELQSTGNTQYLLYDGHGSTRQLAEYDTEVSIVDSFSYDAYGVLLQNESVASANPGKVAQQATSLLYAGEHFDIDSQNYYLRARWYDSLSGRFNRMDPFVGNNQDPQSLHKYLYAHCNPVMNIDPSGRTTSAIELNISFVIGALLVFILVATTVLNPVWRRANRQLVEALIASTVALVAAAGMPFKDGWRRIKETWNRVKEYFKDRGGIYLHYGYRRHWGSFLTLGLLPGKFATRDVYLYGWMAKMFLALPHPEPPNAVYIIWPKKGFGPTYQGIVPPKNGMPGLGYEYFFAQGSGGPLTAFGPIPIPRGENVMGY